MQHVGEEGSSDASETVTIAVGFRLIQLLMNLHPIMLISSTMRLRRCFQSSPFFRAELSSPIVLLSVVRTNPEGNVDSSTVDNVGNRARGCCCRQIVLTTDSKNESALPSVSFAEYSHTKLRTKLSVPETVIYDYTKDERLLFV